MVQMMMSSEKLQSGHGSKGQEKTKARVKAEEPLDEDLSPLNKRSRVSVAPPLKQQWGTGTMVASAPPPQQIPLDDPPLGLRLRKSPSLLDLIQMRLSQGNSLVECSGGGGGGGGGGGELGKKDLKVGVGPIVLSNTDKLKASNFPASLLRIGTWECVSRYEGDLVAKCYFAKHKLVWEVLDGGLKSKMEIQWSDIVGLKANYPENGPGTLDIVLARQPLFFRETNPQPRKHTLWQATSDFTGGQASLHRRHFVQCPQGLLGKHFEKLIQCDPRLNWLSQQPEIVLESPHFESKSSLFEDPDESKSCHGLDKLKNEYVPTFSGFRDTPSPPAVQSSKSELRDTVIGGPDHLARQTPSPSSVMDSYTIEDAGTRKGREIKGLSHLDQLKVPGLRTSMSMSDLADHIGQCLSEQMTPGNPLFSEVQNRETLEGIAQYLLSDSQLASTSDEQSLMSRVNSLCCLLQKDLTSGHNLQPNNEFGSERWDLSQLQQNPDSVREGKSSIEFVTQEGDFSDASGCKPAPSMSRKDSLGDLLLHLPRIASLPQFLFNIPEDGENQAR